MKPEDLFNVYLFIVLCISIIGIYRYNKLGSRIKLVVWLVLFTMISEYLGVLFKYFHIKKAILYHIYSYLEISIYTLYFIATLKIKSLNIKILSIAFWFLLALVNILFFQKATKFNSYILIVESFSIIAMSLYALYKIILDDYIIQVFRSPHFWIWSAALFYWSGTYFYFAFIDWIYFAKSSYTDIMSYFDVFLNIIFYMIVGLIFLKYPKKYKQ